jgi:hypothetical protein
MFSCMRASPLQEDPTARFNVEEMPKKIEIELPDEVYGMLEMEAEALGMSLSEVIKSHLGVRGKALSFEEVAARRRARGPVQRKAIDSAGIIREGRGE